MKALKVLWLVAKFLGKMLFWAVVALTCAVLIQKGLAIWMAPHTAEPQIEQRLEEPKKPETPKGSTRIPL